MHTHLVAASACCYKCITCMDECIRVMDVKTAVDLAIDIKVLSIYDLAVQSMDKFDSVTCFY